LSSRFAVLTGDIVNSTEKLGNRLVDVQKSISNMPIEFNKYFTGSIHEKVSIHRGDGWQILVLKPKYSIRFALYLKSRLKSEYDIETRISIGVGEITINNNDNVSASSGEAYQFSGHGLDTMKKDRYLGYTARSGKHLYEILFLDCLMQKHTQMQAKSFSFALLGLKQAEITKELSGQSTKQKSQQSVSKLLDKCNWQEIQEYLLIIEK